jgi:hypothetical protein
MTIMMLRAVQSRHFTDGANRAADLCRYGRKRRKLGVHTSYRILMGGFSGLFGNTPERVSPASVRCVKSYALSEETELHRRAVKSVYAVE